jgi:hypothetical protein
MTKMENKLYINIKGKDFVLYEGLLNEFHKNGGKEIRTELIQTVLKEETFFIFKAVVIGEKGTFEAYGDACKGNVGAMILPHMMRMAETRAKARALRDYNNIGVCSVEELGGTNEAN